MNRRIFIVKKAIPGADRYARRGFPLPSYCTMVVARGFLQPIADARKVENDMKLFNEYFEVKMGDGSPIPA